MDTDTRQKIEEAIRALIDAENRATSAKDDARAALHAAQRAMRAAEAAESESHAARQILSGLLRDQAA